MLKTSPISIRGYTALELDFSEWRQRIGQLRWWVFCRDLEWVPGDASHLELDKFDQGAIHLGVVSDKDPESLLCYVRLLPFGRMMIQDSKVGLSLCAEGVEIPPKAVEASRHCHDPHHVLKTMTGGLVLPLLYTFVLHVMQDRDFSHLFAVADVEEDAEHLGASFYQKHLPRFLPAGRPITFRDGAKTVLLGISIFEFATDLDKYQRLLAK